MTKGPRRQYDHRIRQAVVATRNIRLFPDLELPVSTARTWLIRGCPRVVAANDTATLHAEIAILRGQAEMYLAISSVLLVIIRIFGLNLDTTQLPEGTEKAELVRAIKMASHYTSLRRLLSLVGLSPSRYHAWKRKKLVCELDDQPSCPRSQPTQLTAAQVKAIKRTVLNPELRHMTVRALSLRTQRLSEVFAPDSTWRRLIRGRRRKRSCSRVYPAKPKTVVRATRPNEWWHIDLTVIRLTSGAKVTMIRKTGLPSDSTGFKCSSLSAECAAAEHGSRAASI